jgi:hypothetical protein
MDQDSFKKLWEKKELEDLENKQHNEKRAKQKINQVINGMNYNGNDDLNYLKKKFEDPEFRKKFETKSRKVAIYYCLLRYFCCPCVAIYKLFV